MKTAGRQYTWYLYFMLIACGGALIWQLFFPQLGEAFTSWGMAPGWQREIALWNVGLIAAVSAVLVRGSLEGMKLMTLQCTVLCWYLGLNHLLALVQDFSLSYGIHLLGVLEVLLLGGIWGTFLLIKGRK